MPTYDYSCRSCGARFEAWQKMTDDPIAICPTCGGPVRRIIYPVGLVFKGSGFYSTDNHRPVGTSSDSHSGGDAGQETSTAATPAASAAADATSGSGSDGKRAGSADTTAKPASSAAAAPAASTKG